MNEDGVAGLELDKDFFWEEMPLQKDGKPAQGTWLITRGGDKGLGGRKGLNLKTVVDFYTATKNKVLTENIQQEIDYYFNENIGFCDLSGNVGGVDYDFVNIRIRPVSTPNNSGYTENGLIVKVSSYELTYDINR